MENQEMYVQQPVKKTSGLGTAALVLGIIAIVLSFIPIIRVLVYVLGPLAFIFGLISLIKKRSVGVAVAGVILAIAAVVLTIVLQAATIAAVDSAVKELDNVVSDINTDMGNLTGENTEDILANYADVTFGKFTVTKGDFIDDCKLPVTVKNKGDEKKSFSIQVEAVDKDGNRIGDDYVYANDLGAGQSQTFDVFTLITSDDMEKYKAATFKVVEISMF